MRCLVPASLLAQFFLLGLTAVRASGPAGTSVPARVLPGCPSRRGSRRNSPQCSRISGPHLAILILIIFQFDGPLSVLDFDSENKRRLVSCPSNQANMALSLYI